MKVVIYCNNDDKNKLNGAAVTAYSIRKNGNLPENTKFILYTFRPEQAMEYHPIRVAFDEAMIPPRGVDWNTLPKWNPIRRSRWHMEVWTKLLSWINTPCDGEPVAVVDYDMLCLGSIREAIPTGDKIFSGRRGWVMKQNKSAIGCNGGFYIKAPAFDTSEAPRLMAQPLFLGNAFCRAKRTWNISDEGGPTWYFLTRGFDKFLSLEYKFNVMAGPLIKHGGIKDDSDIRLLHFAGMNKPWKNDKKRRAEPAFRHICNLWDAVLSEILQSTEVKATHEN